MSKTDQEDGERVGSSPTHISDPKLAWEARRALTWAGVIGLVALSAFMARSLLIVFGGMVIAAMIDGGSRLLGRVLPIGRGWRVSIVIAGVFAFMVAVAVYAGSTIAQEAAELPEIVREQVSNALQWARANGFQVDGQNVQGIASQLASGVGTVTKALTGVLGGLTSVVLMIFLGIYIALEPRLYERGLAWILPEEQRENFFITTSRMAHALRHLLGGRLLGMVVEGIFTWAMLAAYGVPMATLLGLLTGLLAFIPNIGAVLSGVLMVLVGFSGGTDMGLYTIFVYFTVQTIDGYILIPLIAKRTVDLAPALVLSAQLIMGVLFGILGLALADPLMAMIKVALERRSEQYDAAHKAQEEAEADA